MSAPAGPVRFSRLTACPQRPGGSPSSLRTTTSRGPTRSSPSPRRGVSSGWAARCGGSRCTATPPTPPPCSGCARFPRRDPDRSSPGKAWSAGRLDVDPSQWPALRGGAIRGAGAHPAGDVWIFPERYVPLRDSSLRLPHRRRAPAGPPNHALRPPYPRSPGAPSTWRCGTWRCAPGLYRTIACTGRWPCASIDPTTAARSSRRSWPASGRGSRPSLSASRGP